MTPLPFTYPEKKEATTRMDPNPRTYARSRQVETTRWGIRDLRLSVLTLIVSLILGGCSTHLGYVPHDVYAPSFWPDVNVADKSPSYQDVKNWAFNVADGYDSRATANRQALYFGALTAAAGASALTGLAAFAPGSSAIIGIPIGTTFLSGAMAIYNNEQKAVIYGYASQTIRDLLIQSDCRILKKCGEDATAVCLHAEVSEVMRRVDDHITLLDPKNVADRLKAVASSIEAKEALVAHRKERAATAAAALKKALGAGSPTVDELQKEKDAADAALEKALDDLKAAREQNTVEDLAAAANDFSDLQVVPNLCPNLCENVLKTDCQLRK